MTIDQVEFKPTSTDDSSGMGGSNNMNAPHSEANNEATSGTPADSYVYDEARFSALETEMVELIQEQAPSDKDVVTIVVPWNSPFAGVGHMSETKAYEGYENHEAMEPYEERSVWIYTVDTTRGVVEHVKRLVKPLDEAERLTSGLTGVEIVDDRLQATVPEEAVDLDTIQNVHSIESIGNCVNVTSNHVTERGVDPHSLESAMNTLRSYKATFLVSQLLAGGTIRDASSLDISSDLEGLFAYLNPKAIKSLGRTGLVHELLANGEFHIPDSKKPGGYDHDYVAVFIPNSQHNRGVFTVPFIYEPLEGEEPDRRQEFRAMVSDFIVNEEVPVLELKHGDNNTAPAVVERIL